MPHWMLTWQTAAVGAGLLLAGSWIALRLVRGTRARKGAAVLRETGVILSLYALWQYAGGMSFGRTGDAVNHGQWIWHVERAWHLPSEAWVQQGVVHHQVLVQVFNIYYATMHFGVLIAALIWMFLRHRDAYARMRTTLVVTTGGCLLVGLVPVAPPRLVHVGMVDTAAAYGESVYAMAGAIGADQYAAMPSVHVAWAALVPVAVITASRSGWRWLILWHFVVTIYVVVATANHYWADAVVAIALLAFSLALQALVPRLLGRLNLRRLYASTAAAEVPEGDRLTAR
jgi:hypothetical protein